MPAPRKVGKGLWALLGVSFGLRTALTAGGGQLYWPDELRYEQRALLFLEYALRGELGAAARLLAQHADHSLFTPIGAAAAAVQRLVMLASGLTFERTLWAAALALSLASVACVALVYDLARRRGADDHEALMAAALMAASSVMFYYSRHLLPYDAGLLLLLLALRAGLAETGGSLPCGILAGTAFLVYNGVWSGCTAVILLHALTGRRKTRRSAVACVAAIAPLILLSVIGAAAGLPLAAAAHRLFVTAIVVAQGDFGEGWRLPWEFLWKAEHGLLILWLAGAAALLRRARAVPERGRLWLVGIVVITALLAVSSSLGMVVYGRAARQLVPFLCLAAACAWSQAPRALRRAAPVLAAAIVLQAAVNFSQPLRQAWPMDAFSRLDAAAICAVTVEGPAAAQTPSGCPAWYSGASSSAARFILLNATPLYPVLGEKPAPAGRVVWSLPHPLQFEPYLYEGHSPEMRALCRKVDLSIRLVDTGS